MPSMPVISVKLNLTGIELRGAGGLSSDSQAGDLAVLAECSAKAVPHCCSRPATLMRHLSERRGLCTATDGDGAT